MPNDDKDAESIAVAVATLSGQIDRVTDRIGPLAEQQATALTHRTRMQRQIDRVDDRFKILWGAVVFAVGVATAALIKSVIPGG